MVDNRRGLGFRFEEKLAFEIGCPRYLFEGSFVRGPSRDICVSCWRRVDAGLTDPLGRANSF